MITFHDRIRVIDNFLPDEQVYKAYGMIDQMPSNWFLNKKSYINHEGTRVIANDWWNIHGDRFRNPPLDPNGEMTYQFGATEAHQPGCNCVYCETMQFMSENPPPDVGADVITQHMLTVYKPGDYLSQHTDDEGTTWAFTLTLSAGWQPEWGGILHIQDPEDGEWYAFPPTFNRLILMDLTQGPPLNHFVSKVTDDALQNRITLSGWYSNTDKTMVDVDHENVTETVLEHEPNPNNQAEGHFVFTEHHDAVLPEADEPVDLDQDYPSIEDIDKAQGF